LSILLAGIKIYFGKKTASFERTSPKQRQQSMFQAGMIDEPADELMNKFKE